MTSETTFRDRLHKARAIQGLSQNELAQAIGKDTAQISKWVRGRNNPRPKTMLKIAQVLKVSMLWLVFGEGPMEAAITPEDLVSSESSVSPNPGN